MIEQQWKVVATHLSEDIEVLDVLILAKLRTQFLLSRMITVQQLHSNHSGKEKLGATSLG